MRRPFPPGAPVREFPAFVGHCMSRRVLSLEYVNVNVHDSPVYRHAFTPGVELWGLSDGALYMRLPRNGLWNLYDLEEGET